LDDCHCLLPSSALSEWARFDFSLAQHQDVSDLHRTADVSAKNTILVASFQDFATNLDCFSTASRASHNLLDFGRDSVLALGLLLRRL
jgi:hypothetical protein